MIKSKGDQYCSKTKKDSAGYEKAKEVNSNIFVGLEKDQDGRLFSIRIEREWLSTNEAAQYLSISENALRIMVHREQIRAFKFGRRLRFKVADCQGLFQPKGA